jgi:hypothetical protein
MGRIVRACVDATGFRLLSAKITGGCLLLDNCLLVSRIFMIVGLSVERMHIDIPVRTISRAQTTADAPVFNDHLERVAPADRSDGAAHHAERVAALPAGRCHKEILKPEALAHQARNAIVRIGACGHARIASSALVEVQNQ